MLYMSTYLSPFLVQNVSNDMRIFVLALLLLFAWLQYTLWFGKNGVSDYYAVKDEIEVQQQVNSKLQSRNNEMFAEIDDLRQGLDAIEERARHELGLVKDEETFYRIVGEESH
ncbi:cell division protein FtsB [Vibrio sagamiensis NBRC 104589]|uniref:Cell division protein FtsB n=2 Tax=Vibrio sagamiensis TaxID=512650 RepID=A0A511QGP2_9VIBR|nr:cell division protein FtsB [Vibrio sagamiensis NBRC 104589]